MSDWLWAVGAVVAIGLFYWWLERPTGPDTVDRFKSWR